MNDIALSTHTTESKPISVQEEKAPAEAATEENAQGTIWERLGDPRLGNLRQELIEARVVKYSRSDRALIELVHDRDGLREFGRQNLIPPDLIAAFITTVKELARDQFAENRSMDVDDRENSEMEQLKLQVKRLSRALGRITNPNGTFPMSSGSEAHVFGVISEFGLSLEEAKYPTRAPRVHDAVGESIQISQGDEVQFHPLCASQIYKLLWSKGHNGKFVVYKVPVQTLPGFGAVVPSGNADMMICSQPREAVPLDVAYDGKDLPVGTEEGLERAFCLVDVKTAYTLQDRRCVLSAVSKLIVFNLVTRGRITTVFHSDFCHDDYVEEVTFSSDCSKLRLQWISYSQFEERILELVNGEHIPRREGNLYRHRFDGLELADIASQGLNSNEEEVDEIVYDPGFLSMALTASSADERHELFLTAFGFR